MTPTWEVRAVERLQDSGAAAPLDEGWEPFGVTINMHGRTIYHLRRKKAER